MDKKQKAKGDVSGGNGNGSDSDSGSANRYPTRARSMSTVGAESAANNITYDEFKAQQQRAEQAFIAAGGKGAPTVPMASAPLAAASSAIALSLSSSSPIAGIMNALSNRNNSRGSGGNSDGNGNGDSKQPLVTPGGVAVSANDGRSRDRAHRRSRSHRRHRSSSVDSRSDESEDESLRGVESLYYRGRRIRAEDQYAVDMTASVKATHGTFVSWGSDNKFYSKRNGSEQELLCAVIDCMNSGHHQVALELLCRRLAGASR
jgi:hypothetical protein